MNLEDLSPELQEKVKACTTADELAQLAKENGVELTDEELEEVSGGASGWFCTGKTCPKFFFE